LEEIPENIDSQEIARFASHADEWWDLKGQYKALHQINPVRLAYVRDMAAAGARVTGIDMAAPSLAVARRHALETGVAVDYRQSTAEAWAGDHREIYDVITCMELVEHVPDPAGLVQALSRMVRPGGEVFFATVNRTWLARLLVIWFSENVFGIVPRGTHTYGKFVQPRELTHWARQAGLETRDLSGLRYIPFNGHAALCRNTTMNYLMHFCKTG
jgi:2-polyprenyl-6-hydroxyphenyl methylase/3-demethylubiquinone-9 3-methyltransferase